MIDDGTNRWSNWSGTTSVVPQLVSRPTSTGDVVAAIKRAAGQGQHLKMPGSGHSFTDIAIASDVLLDPAKLTGITALDREQLTVTVRAGTQLSALNKGLESHALSLHNMGDIMEQTVAGAISTGTHGTGGTAASLAMQLAGLEIVDGAGQVHVCSAHENPEIFKFARVGLGALGVLTSLTFAVEPAFVLHAHERPMTWTELLERHDELITENHHFEAFYWPHTDAVFAKFNNRTLDVAEPLSSAQYWLDDKFLSNTVFGALIKLGQKRPSLVAPINRLAGRVQSERSYSDVPYRVFTSPRTVRFVEMEYALPRVHALSALREVRQLIDASGWNIGFPIEIRNAPADDIPLSTAFNRDSVYLAFHVPTGSDHRPYFDAVEAVMKSYSGRPHWGKLHQLGANELAELYPEWEGFVALRDQMDPQRVFSNDYLKRVLGD